MWRWFEAVCSYSKETKGGKEVESPVDSRTLFHLHIESGPTQLTNVNSLEGGCPLKFKTIESAQCHSGSAITNR